MMRKINGRTTQVWGDAQADRPVTIGVWADADTGYVPVHLTAASLDA